MAASRIWTTPSDYVDGDMPGATEFNRDVRDNLAFLAQPAVCTVYRTSDQTGIVAASETLITWQAAETDSDVIWDVADPTKLTIPSGWPGLWEFSGNVYFQSGASATASRLKAQIRLNGTTIIHERPIHAQGNLGSFAIPLQRHYRMIAGDYVEVRVYAGADFDELDSGVSRTTFTAAWRAL